MVNIVGQASYKLKSVGNRWDLNQWNSTPRNQVSQERDMQFQSRHIGIGRWLTDR